MKNNDNLLFVGFGNMAEAIFTGIDNKINLDRKNIFIQTKTNSKKESIKQLGINNHFIDNSEANNFDDIKYIFFGCKPYQIKEIIDEYIKYDNEDNIIISMLAGTPISFFESKFKNSNIVRIMPNMASVINRGITGIYSKNIDEYHKTKIDNLIANLGINIWVKSEFEIEIITALTGCGTGIIAKIIRSFAEIISKKESISINEAENISINLFKIALNNIDIQSTKILEIQQVIQNAIEIAINRSVEIGKNLENNSSNNNILDQVKNINDELVETEHNILQNNKHNNKDLYNKYNQKSTIIINDIINIFIEIIENKLACSNQEAIKIALELFHSTIIYAESLNKNMKEIIYSVCSKTGPTECAIKIMNYNNFNQLLLDQLNL